MQDFSLAVFGYRRSEVELALQSMEETIQRMHREISEMKLKINSLEMENADLETLLRIRSELLKGLQSRERESAVPLPATS